MNTADDVYKVELNGLALEPVGVRMHKLAHLNAARVKTSLLDPADFFQRALKREKDCCGICRAHVA